MTAGADFIPSPRRLQVFSLSAVVFDVKINTRIALFSHVLRPRALIGVRIEWGRNGGVRGARWLARARVRV